MISSAASSSSSVRAVRLSANGTRFLGKYSVTSSPVSPFSLSGVTRITIWPWSVLAQAYLVSEYSPAFCSVGGPFKSERR